MDTDFDPLTEEGKDDINDTVDDEYDSLLPGGNETPESWESRFKGKFGRGYRYAINRFNDLFKLGNKGSNLPQYMELEDLDSKREIDEFNQSEAQLVVSILQEVYPEYDYDGNYKGLNKYFRINDDAELEFYRPNTKKWELLSSDESKLPVQLRKSLGWSKEQTNISYASGVVRTLYNQPSKRKTRWLV